MDCANWFVSLAPTTLNAGGADGLVALLGVEILEPPPPFPPGVLTDVICLTVAIPEATAAAAAIPPKTGPTIGIPANELNADCAPLYVSIVVCAIAAAFPAALLSPKSPARLPNVSEATDNFCSDVSLSIFISSFAALFFKSEVISPVFIVASSCLPTLLISILSNVSLWVWKLSISACLWSTKA